MKYEFLSENYKIKDIKKSKCWCLLDLLPHTDFILKADWFKE